jgi:hypothetical protein
MSFPASIRALQNVHSCSLCVSAFLPDFALKPTRVITAIRDRLVAAERPRCAIRGKKNPPPTISRILFSA